MGNFFPKVSIVIPVYNGANYMREAIDSALNQTYKNIEVIVVNDGSTDNGETDRVAKSYGQKIRYYSKSNGGVATALNLGIEKMTGEYFSWLSHDDKYKPEKVQRQIEELEKLDDKKTLLFGGYQNFSDEHGVFETMDFFRKFKKEELEKPLFPVFHMALNGCTLLIHKSHFERVGMFDPALPTTQDYDLWFRMFRYQHARCMPGCYVLSRAHPDQGSKLLIPVHTKECEALWLKCFNAITEEEMIELSGNRYSFYSENYDHFTKHCFYPAINAYLRKCALQEIVKMKIPTDSLFSDIYANLKADGNQSMIMESASKTKKRKRIAFFLGNPNDLGGLNRIVLQTAGALCDFFDVWLIDTLKYNGEGYEKDERIEEVTLEWNFYKIIDMLSLLQIDVLVNSYNCLDFSLQLCNEAKKTGIKVIGWSHEHFFSPYRYDANRHLGYRMASLGNMDAVIWLTHYSGRVYGIHHDNGIVFPNMISLQKPTVEENQRKKSVLGSIKKNGDEQVVIGVARFDDERKGLDRLLRVFSRIYARNNKARLLLVGSVDWEASCCIRRDTLHGNVVKKYSEVLKECKIPAGVVFATGQVNDVRGYYEEADLHLLTSRYEGFGLVITESALYEVPTIAFDGNGYEDIIDQGQGGFIVTTENEMVDKACYLLGNPLELNKMGKYANQRTARFAPAKIVKKWVELIDHVVDDTHEQLQEFLNESHKKDGRFSTEELKELVREMETDIALRQEAALGQMQDAATTMDGNAYYRQQIENMERTLSWRITKPLRVVRRMMNKQKRR